MLQLCQCLGASQAWQNLWAKAGLFASSLRANKLPQSAALELRYKSNVALKPPRPIQLGLGPLLVGKAGVRNSAPHTICAKQIVPKGTLVRLGCSGKT